MKHLLFLLLTLLGFWNSGASQDELRIVTFSQIDSLISTHHEELHVVNFWATWCKPCVAELPYFRKASRQFEDEPVHFIFVSLDFDFQVESKLRPFLQKEPLPGKQWWLNEKKFGKMIDKVEENWSGAIPFTLFLKGSPEEKSFHEAEITQEQLIQMIDQNL